MKEHFTIRMKNSYNFRPLIIVLVCLFLSFVIVYPTLGFRSIPSVLSFLLLSTIIYVIITSITQENQSNELPSTLYPSSPHLGLDGISLNSFVTGLDTNLY
jgi:MFS superfamily sulfate permease-like transporter